MKLKNNLVSLKTFPYNMSINFLKTHNMTNEYEKLQSMNNAELSMEFLKKYKLQK